MKTLYKEDFSNQTITHPRYKTLQIITLNNGEVWVNLNDLCQNCRTTTTSAIASLPSQEQHLRYMKIISDSQLQILITKPANGIDYTPYIDLNAIPIVNLFRAQYYKKQIAQWIVLELQEPILPTINQMVILSSDPKPNTLKALNQHLETLKGKVRTFAQTHPQDDQPTDPAIFTPLQGNCTIDKLLALFKENGINLTKQKFTTWLSDNEYICHSRKFRNRPLIKYCKRGYFFDNRHIYITRYPLNALLFTPLGQLYFYDKIYTSINF